MRACVCVCLCTEVEVFTVLKRQKHDYDSLREFENHLQSTSGRAWWRCSRQPSPAAISARIDRASMHNHTTTITTKGGEGGREGMETNDERERGEAVAKQPAVCLLV